MSDLNMTVIMGRLVRDPIIRNNGGGRMGFFSIASNRHYRDKANEWQEETAFISCKCFGNWTDALAGRKKGATVIVEGRLRTETWDDNGTSRSQLVLVCDSLRFVVPESRNQNSPPSSDGEEVTSGANGSGKEAGKPPF